MKPKQSNNKRTFAILCVSLAALIGLGTIAQGFNEAHHKEMALKECKTEQNIEFVNSKTYKCKKTVLAQ